MNTEFDFIVIGAGSGGIATARMAASFGKKVAIIEKGPLGGTCVNVGCVPKKVMWNAASMAHSLDMVGDYGFDIQRNSFDWQQLKSRRDAYVTRLNDIYQRNLDLAEIQVIQGHARFSGPQQLEVDGEVYKAPHILVATGGRPIVPDLPGADLGISSDGFFELESLPERAVIVGAGYIAVELAGVLHSLGSDVSILLRRQAFLRSFDASLRETLMAEMSNAGINILACTHMAGVIRQDNGRLCLTSTHGEEVHDVDCLLWAIGRLPNTGGLNLASVGLETDDRGFISADDYQNTAVQGVYAVGDVTGRTALTPVAIAAGRKLAKRIFGGEQDARLNYDNIASVVFSHPPISTVGLTEEQARENYTDVRVYQSRFTNMLYALSEHKSPTVVKLVTVGNHERIVGVHIIGDAADEIIQGFAVAVNMGACKRDLDETVAIHPTAAEELVTLR
ncbi:MAG TPA: glutathione-disulfide reductase [Gammaproteobacteria bacterium]|nr:glutathione-disulfide reductase [Gammaproteobacteria bacterium]